eukprot:443774_1
MWRNIFGFLITISIIRGHKSNVNDGFDENQNDYSYYNQLLNTGMDWMNYVQNQYNTYSYNNDEMNYNMYDSQTATMQPAGQGTEIIEIANPDLSRIRNRNRNQRTRRNRNQNQRIRRSSDTSLIANRILNKKSNKKSRIRRNSDNSLITKSSSLITANRKRTKSLRNRYVMNEINIEPISPIQTYADNIHYCKKVPDTKYVYQLTIRIEQMKSEVDAYLVYDAAGSKQWKLLIIPDLYLKNIWKELILFKKKQKGITKKDIISRKDELFLKFNVNQFGGAEIDINPTTLIAHVAYIEYKGLYSKPKSDIGFLKGVKFAVLLARGKIKVLTLFNKAIEDTLRNMGVKTIRCEDAAQLICSKSTNPIARMFNGEQVDMFPLRVWQNKKGKFSYYMSIGYHTINKETDERFEQLCNLVADLKWGVLVDEVLDKLTN